MNKIRKFRQEAGITQAQLAAAIGKTVPCISQYENGIHIPPILVAMKIAKVLGCKWNELFEEEAG